MASLNQPFDIFPILSEDGNFVVDDPSVTAYGNFLAGVARIVDGFFKPPFNASGRPDCRFSLPLLFHLLPRNTDSVFGSQQIGRAPIFLFPFVEVALHLSNSVCSNVIIGIFIHILTGIGYDT